MENMGTTMTYDVVSNPKHYHREGVDFECVELSTLFPHPIASAVEYVFRHREKNGVEDLRKALWWLQYAREHEELIAFRVDGELAAKLAGQLFWATNDAHESDFWVYLAKFATPYGMKNKRVMIDCLIQALTDLIKQEEAQV